MSDLARKKSYLQHVIPLLDEHLADKMIQVIKANEKKQTNVLPVVQNDPFQELLSMVGCDNAKTELKAMIADHRMRQIAKSRGRNTTQAHYHAVFLGNPGTAKTTCARLYAQALAKEGITKKDTFAELSRSHLVGRYAGSTAPKIREVFRQNAGGVLFIDEAYSLCSGEGRDYGEEAINEIIICLENYETVCIFAGYPDLMGEFLDSNPGLRSRIPYRVAFDDYSTEELVAISKVIANKQGYEIAESATPKLFDLYETARGRKDFGNGRSVRNVIEAAVRKKGIHLGVMEDLSKFMNSELSDEVLFTLDESCFADAEIYEPEVTRKIGF